MRDSTMFMFAAILSVLALEGDVGAEQEVRDCPAWNYFAPVPAPDTLIITSALHRKQLVASVYNFSQQGGRVFRWDGSSWHPMGGMFSEQSYWGRVESMIVFDGHLVVGGSFKNVDGMAANRVARWNGTSWQPMGSGYSQSNFVEVLSFVIFNGDLYAGGSDYQAGEVKRWNGTQWQPLPQVGFTVAAMCVYQGELIAGGFGSSPPRIARWDGAAWHDLGQGLSGSWGASQMALEVYQDELYVGGAHNAASGVPNTSFIARWNGTEWRSVGNGPTNAQVIALDHYQDKLVAFGGFNIIGGYPVAGIALWDGSEWTPPQVPPPTLESPFRVLRGSMVATALGPWPPDLVRLVRWACPAPACLGDIMNTGTVDVSDLLAVIHNWGPCPPSPPPCQADVNGDGIVNVNDLLVVINEWGPCF